VAGIVVDGFGGTAGGDTGCGGTGIVVRVSLSLELDPVIKYELMYGKVTNWGIS
jgi:hypothetical protein